MQTYFVLTRPETKFDHNYYLRGHPLEKVYEFTDPGVLVSDTLSLKPHIILVISKANKLLGLIKRTLGPLASQKSELLLYYSPVRSSLMYASTLLSPNKGDLELIEGVQRRATKFILNNYTAYYHTCLAVTFEFQGI